MTAAMDAQIYEHLHRLTAALKRSHERRLNAFGTQLAENQAVSDAINELALAAETAARIAADAALDTRIDELTLDDLADVQAPTPSNNDFLKWSSTAGKWINAAISTITGIFVRVSGNDVMTGPLGIGTTITPLTGTALETHGLTAAKFVGDYNESGSIGVHALGHIAALIQAEDDTHTPLEVQGTSDHSTPLQRWWRGSRATPANRVAYIDNVGRGWFSGLTSQGDTIVNNTAPATVALTVNAAAGQTARLFELKDGGVALCYVDNDGNLVAADITGDIIMAQELKINGKSVTLTLDNATDKAEIIVQVPDGSKRLRLQFNPATDSIEARAWNAETGQFNSGANVQVGTISTQATGSKWAPGGAVNVGEGVPGAPDSLVFLDVEGEGYALLAIKQ